MRRAKDSKESPNFDSDGGGSAVHESGSTCSKLTDSDNMQWVNNSRSRSRGAGRSQGVKMNHVLSRFLRMKLLKILIVASILAIALYLSISVFTDRKDGSSFTNSEHREERMMPGHDDQSRKHPNGHRVGRKPEQQRDQHQFNQPHHEPNQPVQFNQQQQQPIPQQQQHVQQPIPQQPVQQPIPQHQPIPQQQPIHHQQNVNQQAVPQQHPHINLQQQPNINQQQPQQAIPQQQQHAQQQQHIQQQQAILQQAVLQQQQQVFNQQQQQQQQQLHQQQQHQQQQNPNTELFQYHIIQSLTNTHKMPHLKTRFVDCIKSILDKASIDLHFFFVTDEPSRAFITETLQDITNKGLAKSRFQFNLLDVDDLAKEVAPYVTTLQEHVSGGHPYYKDAIFFLSVALHKGLLPDNVHQVAMLDTDMKFTTDIKKLFDFFPKFTSENIIALAHEQQPVYRHMLSLYRSKNRGTRVGDPPPNGLTGFNSGVMLLDLDKIRRSTAYASFLGDNTIKILTAKYYFKGHLGDQDFFSLISLEKPDLFYVLPCTWNRQLCRWWQNKGYADVFDQYFSCPEPIDIYHGNCNTPIPENV